MSTLMISYAVKPERAEENAELIRGVFEELASSQPGGLRYGVFELEDGANFVHIVCNETDAPQSPLSELDAFKRYQEQVSERCVAPPVFTKLSEVGSFRFWQ
jgi:quinol monooxygenase YgiN